MKWRQAAAAFYFRMFQRPFFQAMLVTMLLSSMTAGTMAAVIVTSVVQRAESSSSTSTPPPVTDAWSQPYNLAASGVTSASSAINNPVFLIVADSGFTVARSFSPNAWQWSANVTSRLDSGIDGPGRSSLLTMTASTVSILVFFDVTAPTTVSVTSRVFEELAAGLPQVGSDPVNWARFGLVSLDGTGVPNNILAGIDSNSGPSNIAMSQLIQAGSYRLDATASTRLLNINTGETAQFSSGVDFTMEFAPVPEPAALILMLSALLYFQTALRARPRIS